MHDSAHSPPSPSSPSNVSKPHSAVPTAADHSRYRVMLEELAAKDRLRSLAPRAGADFTSNDYLGLATPRRLRRALKRPI